jgi:hypothetical protein
VFAECATALQPKSRKKPVPAKGQTYASRKGQTYAKVCAFAVLAGGMMPRRLVGSLAVLALVFTCAPSALAQSATSSSTRGVQLNINGRAMGGVIRLATAAVQREGGVLTGRERDGEECVDARQHSVATWSDHQIQLAAKLSW